MEESVFSSFRSPQYYILLFFLQSILLYSGDKILNPQGISNDRRMSTFITIILELLIASNKQDKNQLIEMTSIIIR